MTTGTTSKALGLALTASIALLSAACSSKEKTPEATGPVTLIVNGQPPASAAEDRQNFDDDVKAFETKYPNINIEPREGFMDPKTFPAKLAGGQLEDVFYVYFTDPAGLIARRQVMDVSTYLKDYPTLADIRPDLLKVFSDSAGKVYGVPTANYSMGLLYNRKLFTQAGLDPNSPPKTWDDVRAAAKKISTLGNGVVGYGDYSKSNTGGWHFTQWMYSLGGDVATKDGETWKAAFNNDKGKQVLQYLHDMRFTDNSMGSRQLLEWADLLTMMGAGKLGMYLAAPDNVPLLVKQFKGTYADYGLAPAPGGIATLGGGEGYMFKPGLSEAKVRAGLTWIAWKYNNPDRSDEKNQKAKAADSPVGLPEPMIWTGSSAQKVKDSAVKFANVPVENYQSFAQAAGTIQVKVEPPNAQQIYAVLDNVMQAVLTKQDANFDALLKSAETQVNTILASVK